jgi:nitroreductase
VEAEKVAQVLAAANAAPSAGNLQGYEIFRVTHEKERAALAHAALDQFFVAQAPVVLVFCANQARSAAKYRERGARLYAIQDATIACAFAMLAATALGLGTVWVGAFDDAAVRRVLGCHDLLPVAILPKSRNWFRRLLRRRLDGNRSRVLQPQRHRDRQKYPHLRRDRGRPIREPI